MSTIEISRHLSDIGWNNGFATNVEPAVAALRPDPPGQPILPARVCSEHRDLFGIWTAQGYALARVAGSLRHKTGGRLGYPAIGDWVLATLTDPDQATILAVLPRQSQFLRKIAGTTQGIQVVAANVTTTFLVTSLNGDFNPRRLERYLVLAREGGARPVVVLGKADLCDNPTEMLETVEAIAPGVAAHVVSGASGDGLVALEHYFRRGETIALLGSSGVGKSTLVNRILGIETRTSAIRSSDGRGRHTTTHRSLFLIPTGGVLLDTPGMRQIGMVSAEGGFSRSFDDVIDLANGCRFRNCGHRSEPDCKVQAAVSEGSLDEARLMSFRKLGRELAAAVGSPRSGKNGGPGRG